jgi:hypothetical protein
VLGRGELMYTDDQIRISLLRKATIGTQTAPDRPAPLIAPRIVEIFHADMHGSRVGVPVRR